VLGQRQKPRAGKSREARLRGWSQRAKKRPKSVLAGAGKAGKQGFAECAKVTFGLVG